MASNANANTPAASGAAADVPECVFVHLPYKSVVAYKTILKINKTHYKKNQDCMILFLVHQWVSNHNLKTEFNF